MNTQRDGRGRRLRGQRGATLVEFALIFPVFMTMVLGMFSGGTLYNQKSAMASATREGARYASTLPINPSDGADLKTQLTPWLHKVTEYVEKASENSLGVGVDGWEVCVAYVFAPPPPAASDDLSRHETHALNKSTKVSGYNDNLPGQCPGADDVAADGKPRVQVVTRRNGKLEALFFEIDVPLRTKTITRFEALP